MPFNLFVKPDLKVQFNIDLSILTAIQRAKMVAAAAGTLKTCVVVEIIFHIVAIVEMIADDVAILFHYKITAIGIVTPFPLLAWCHAKSRIKQQDFHFVFVESHDVSSCKAEWVLSGNDFNGLFDG